MCGEKTRSDCCLQGPQGVPGVQEIPGQVGMQGVQGLQGVPGVCDPDDYHGGDSSAIYINKKNPSLIVGFFFNIL